MGYVIKYKLKSDISNAEDKLYRQCGSESAVEVAQ